MSLSSKLIAELVSKGEAGEPLGINIVPSPNVDEISKSGESSISLRLGRWFLSMKQNNQTHLDVLPSQENIKSETAIVKKHFVPFGDHFIVHPGRFVLASTLEWVTLPINLAGYVTGKSTLGRRGIVIETAAGVHPSFSGCLTLEIANVGEVPVSLRPGMVICQLFLHEVSGETVSSRTSLSGRRRPVLGTIKPDRVLSSLSRKK
jgi:dCTP deaminase